MKPMKLLVVEDDDNKRSQIIQFLRSTFPVADVELSTSLQGSLRLLAAGSFTFLILDMTLPNYDVGPNEPGGAIHQSGGTEVLRKMRRAGIAIPTAVITQYETFGSGRERVDLESIRATLKRDYPGVCMGTIYYNTAIDSWRHELAEVLKEAHK